MMKRAFDGKRNVKRARERRHEKEAKERKL